MRLGQLARQLDIQPEKIVSFLAKEKKTTIKSHPNAKVDDDLIATIIDYFKPVIEEDPEENKEMSIDEKVKTTEIPAAIVETKVEKVVKEEIKTEVKEKLETIKSSFSGPKIIGKIDLPDKSKIDVEVDGVVYDQETLEKKQKEARETKKIAAEKEAALQKEKALAKALAMQKKEAEQKRREELHLALAHHEKHNVLTKKEEKQQKLKELANLKHEKELKQKQKRKRAENYKKNHETKSIPKKNKKIKKVVTPQKTAAVIIEKEIIKEVVATPKEKNIFKRFLKWLNDE